MDTLIGVGFSQRTSSSEAVTEATIQAKVQTRQRKIDLVIVFNTPHHNPNEFLPILQENFDQAKIVGCSTAAIITSKMIAKRGLGILAIHSEDIRIAAAYVDHVAAQTMHESGLALSRKVSQKFGQSHRKLFLFFTDGDLENPLPFLQGLQEGLGNIFPIIGAGSTDDRFKKTFQYFETKIINHGAVGLLLGGKLNAHWASRHGWQPVGKPRTITKSLGHIIQLIDDQPAITIYNDFFGPDIVNLKNPTGHIALLYPLGIYLPKAREYLLRNVIRIEKDGSLVCNGAVPPQGELHLMISNKDAAMEATHQAALEVKKKFAEKSPSLVIIIDSLARLKLLGRSAFHGIEIIKNIFGPHTAILGMCAHGEIAPSAKLEDQGIVHLQNVSITVIGIS